MRQNEFETKGSEQNVWDEMKGDEVILGQNERGRIERDKMSVGRNEWSPLTDSIESTLVEKSNRVNEFYTTVI